MATYFCSNCKLDLGNNDVMREHYKTEFHHYNIKRHLVSLPPVTLEQFQKKKTLLAESQKSVEEKSIKCEICNKTFASGSTYQQHLKSKKHVEEEKIAKERPVEVESEKKSEAREPRVTTNQDQTVCLFCNQKSSDLNENLLHMRLQHSFFVSDLKHLKDLPGLLKYLGDKINKGCLCIYCENHHCKDFKTGEAVQMHMMDKGHCFMRTEEFDEYHKYYDFSDQIEEMKNNKKLVIDDGEPLKEGEAYMEMESGGEDSENEWEDQEDDDESWEDNDDDEEGAEKKVKKEGEEVQEKKFGPDGEEIFEFVKEKPAKRIHRYKVRKVRVLDSGEIELPNGRILGHRKYKTLYRQYYRQALKENFNNNNYLEYMGERALATISQQTGLMLVQNQLEKAERQKLDKEVEWKMKKLTRNYVKRGTKNHLLVKHFRFQNPK